MHSPRFLFVLLLLALPLPHTGGDDAMTTEDVVVLYVQGVSPTKIIERIRSSEVDFELSEEMVSELRVAGIPVELIEAMRQRQAELHPEQAPVQQEPAEQETSGPTLVLRLNPDWKPKEDEPRPVIRVYDTVDEQIAEQLRLRDDERVIHQLAIALYCRTSDHVPDHWRGKTPLGRDFVAVQRHKILAFVPGGEKIEASKMKNMISKMALVPGARDAAPDLMLLVLEVPEQIEVPLDPGVAHDLTLGIAVQIADRFYLGNWEDLDEVILPDEGLELYAALRSKSKSAKDVRIQFLDP